MRKEIKLLEVVNETKLHINAIYEWDNIKKVMKIRIINSKDLSFIRKGYPDYELFGKE